MTVNIFFSPQYGKHSLSDRDGVAGSCTLPHCFAGGFSICGQHTSGRHIWFIHNRDPQSQGMTGAWEQLDPIWPLPEFCQWLPKHHCCCTNGWHWLLSLDWMCYRENGLVQFKPCIFEVILLVSKLCIFFWRKSDNSPKRDGAAVYRGRLNHLYGGIMKKKKQMKWAQHWAKWNN